MSTTVNKAGNHFRNNRRPARLNIKKSIKERNDSLFISGSELIDLLSPVTPASFTTEYWCRKPLFIKGSPGKLQKLFPGGFERKDFYRAVREAATKKVQGFRLLARKNEGLLPFGNGQTEPYIVIEPHQMEWMIASGANISASSIIDQRAATLAAAIKTQLNYPGEIRVVGTLSPKDNGWPPHIDATSALLIQCEGRKRFLISEEPVIEWPRWHAVFSSDGSFASYSRDIEPWEEIEPIDLGSLKEVVMEPGDILFLPPGTVHGTEALSESTLNIGLMFEHTNFLSFISRTLERILISDPDWRHLPPINSARVEPGKLPAEAVEFFAARLAELRDVINALTPESLELNRLWQRSISDPGDSILASLSLNSAKLESRPIERKDLLRVSRKAPITYTIGTDSDGEESIDLFFADKEVTLSGEWVSFLKRMVEKERFTAASTMKWAEGGRTYPWKIVREYLEALLDQGILERETA